MRILSNRVHKLPAYRVFKDVFRCRERRVVFAKQGLEFIPLPQRSTILAREVVSGVLLGASQEALAVTIWSFTSDKDVKVSSDSPYYRCYSAWSG
jgi:hypothetical protein